MKLQVTARPGVYHNDTHHAQGETFEIEGDEIPRVFKGSVREVTETTSRKAKKGHVLMRVTSDAAIYLGDKRYGLGDIIEMTEAQAESRTHRAMLEPADKPTPVNRHGDMPHAIGAGVH